jgi:hypothetical protein
MGNNYNKLKEATDNHIARIFLHQNQQKWSSSVETVTLNLFLQEKNSRKSNNPLRAVADEEVIYCHLACLYGLLAS